MPSTVVTKENYPASVKKARVDKEIKLRIKAGAIRCWTEEPKWTLCTEWNVIGE